MPLDVFSACGTMPAMKTNGGFTLIELLVVMVIASVVTLGAFGSWQSWQQLQRLNDSARQIQSFLLRLRGEANERNSQQMLWRADADDAGWCLGSGLPQRCRNNARRVIFVPWSDIALQSLTEGMGFYGRRNAAKPGRIVITSPAGTRHIILSSRGRVRICDEVCP